MSMFILKLVVDIQPISSSEPSIDIKGKPLFLIIATLQPARYIAANLRGGAAFIIPVNAHEFSEAV
jgi:hypothetical protein